MGKTSGTKRLYLRVPFKIEEELNIKELHPDITKVIIPRQKSARWCFVEFEDEEKCQSAYKILKKKKIDGKGIKAKLSIKPEKKVSRKSKETEQKEALSEIKD